VSSGDSLEFTAGQYIHVRHPSGRRIPFTIASAPHALPNLQIHFQPVAGNDESSLMRDAIASGEIEIEDVQGSVTLESMTQPHLLFVCAGSGFAQAHSMLSSAIHQNHPAKRTLMWAVDSPTDFYARDLLRTIGHSASIHLFADRRRDPSNSGMLWLRNQAPRITSDNVVLCGSPNFVYAVTDLLITAGVPSQCLHSDVYAYAPR